MFHLRKHFVIKPKKTNPQPLSLILALTLTLTKPISVIYNQNKNFRKQVMSLESLFI